MRIMICLGGEEEQLPCLPEILELGSGIELGSYGLMGVRSEKDWELTFERHKRLIEHFRGDIALHGPFIGVDYIHIDHIFRDAVQKRMDMIFDVTRNLKASRVVLHSGFKSEYELFKLEKQWLADVCEYWKHEIARWEEAKISVVLENDIDRSPDLLIKVIDEVNSPYFGLCLDVGHLNIFSSSKPSGWVEAMGTRLQHVHLHDNDGIIDHHWSIGKGVIDFESFYDSLAKYTPHATVSLEVNADMDTKLNDLRRLSQRFPA